MAFKPSGGRQNAQLSGPGRRLGAVVNTQFAKDIAGVDFDGMLGEEELGRDLWIG